MLQRTLCNAIFDDALLKERHSDDRPRHAPGPASHRAGLRAEAEAHRLASEAQQARLPRNLRARLGWTLVEVGLRIASAPRLTVTPAH